MRPVSVLASFRRRHSEAAVLAPFIRREDQSAGISATSIRLPPSQLVTAVV
ncbi:hypothetical protein PIB30_051566 [Stylosanthes scabra]|uniref:Uncharacterized protein n=1 Tax=Stylosanthes scabra TaxID=79078 RepID=A0ABU6RIP2_9FABA|nr:hypothetical protein [Stylosanthes scabra]